MRHLDPRTGRTRLGIAVQLFVGTLFLASAAQAATVTVTITTDENDGSCADTDCSLRDAVATAAPGDTVVVPAGTYTVTLGMDISINKNLAIVGDGARTTIIDNTSPGGSPNRIFQVGAGSVVEISDVTMTGGTPSVFQSGGAILNSGELTVRRCTVSNNFTTTGSGIANVGGVLTLIQSTVTGNGSSLGGFDAGDGGGLSIDGGSATIVNSTISGNAVASNRQGGGIFVSSGEVGIIHSTISANTAGTGGGLAVAENGNAFASGTIIAGNSGGDCAVPGFGLGVSTANLDSDESCSGFSLSADPQLDSLADNGGPTDTHALADTSPALDAGDATLCASAPVNGVDQRDVTRPQGDECDLGAFEFQSPNQSPDCSAAAANPSTLAGLLLLGQFVSIQVTGVTDPDGDPVTITVTSIFQDEAVSELILGLLTSPDGTGVGSANPRVRAERRLLLLSNGRVYHIRFDASDGNGGSCSGDVTVSVPPLLGPAVDNGPNFDSTVP